METHDHSATPRGRAFLWGGIGAGVLLLLLLLTHGFGLFGAGRGSVAQSPPLVHQGSRIFIPASSPLRRRLTVMPASAQSTAATVTLPGIVESNPARTAAVLPPLSGRVLELKVALGERVRRGQALAIINSPDLGQAWDDDDKAADTLDLSTRNLARQEEQFRIGAASQRDLDQARSEHTQAVAEHTRTQARLTAIGVAGDGARSRLLTVRAPVSGSVTALSVAAGNMINDPTQPIMTIADLSTVWVTALVPEKDVAGIAAEQDAQVALAAYPGRTWRGKVLFVSDVIEPDSRRNKVRIAFENADHALKPNMFATVTLQGRPQQRVILPSSALLMNNDRTSVFVATAPWTFERRSVDLQLEESSSVTISSGVNPGEQVLVRGGILLND